MAELHYELTGESKQNIFGYTVHRIRATRDIPGTSVKKGDVGGWIGTLMDEVKRRRQHWGVDDAQAELWMMQYRALKKLCKATVAR